MAEGSGLGRFGTIIISLIDILILVVIGLQAATLYLYLNDEDKDGSSPESPSIQLPVHDFMRQTFPGRFFTDAEIELFARSFANSTSPELNATIPDDFTRQCVDDYCEIELAEMHSCCCKIKSSLKPYRNATDYLGVNRTIAQFEGISQYFYTQTCNKTGTDPSCSCVLYPILSSGVYVINETSRQYGVGFFYLGQTCVGLNT